MSNQQSAVSLQLGASVVDGRWKEIAAIGLVSGQRFLLVLAAFLLACGAFLSGCDSSGGSAAPHGSASAVGVESHGWESTRSGERVSELDKPGQSGDPKESVDSTESPDTKNPENEKSDGRVEHWLGPDGMRVILVHRDDGFVTLDINIETGSIDDPPDRIGLAHLSGKMMLFGSEELDSWALDDRLADLAGRLDADVDETSTTLSGEVVARNAPRLLGLMADLVQHPNKDEKTFEKVKRLVIGRLALDREDDSLMAMRFFSRAVYANHPYGRWPEGSARSLRRIGLDDVKRHRKKWYRNANIILSVSGDIDRQTLEAAIAGAFPGEDQEPPQRAERPFKDRNGRKVLLVNKPDRTQNQIVIGQRVVPPTHEDWPALVVATTILGGNFSSRLSRDLRAEKGWTYGVYSEQWRQPRTGTFVTSTFTAPDRAMDAINAVLNHIETLVDEGVTADEASVASEYAAGNFELKTDTPARLAAEAARFMHYGLTMDDLQHWPERLSAVDAKAVNSALKRLVDPMGLTIVMLCSSEHFEGQFTDMEAVRSVEVAEYDEQ